MGMPVHKIERFREVDGYGELVVKRGAATAAAGGSEGVKPSRILPNRVIT